MTDRPTVVVCGGTGQQGGAVVDRLLARGDRLKLVAFSRQPDSPAAAKLRERGLEVARGDLRDRSSLERLFRGAAAVFGVTQPWSAGYKKVDGAGEVEQGRNIIEACRAAGVPHLVLSTAMQTDGKPTGIPHLDSKQEIERALLASGQPFTLLRPAMFIENIGLPFFPVKRGKLRGFVDGDAKLPFMGARDVGEAAAVAICAPAQWLGHTIDLVSDYVSGEDICRFLEHAHPGQKYRYTCPPRLLMRLFAREFFQMREGAEVAGRPPFPNRASTDKALSETRAMVPEWMSVEKYVLTLVKR